MSWAELARHATIATNDVVLLYAFAINTHYLILLLVGFRATVRFVRSTHSRDLRSAMQSPFVPPVSVIVPAYNEEGVVVEAVRGLLTLHYPRFEVIVVNDGSRDATLERLVESFKLRPVPRTFDYEVPCKPIRGIYRSPDHPSLVVVDKENGRKADALNAGLNVSVYPLFAVVDADSLLEPDALLRVAQPFAEDETTVGSGGTIRIANGCGVRAGRVESVRFPARVVPAIQVLEYLRAFLFGRTGWGAVGGLLIISGSFGMFSKRAAMEAGGYDVGTVGEDMELVVRLHRTLRDRQQPYRIRFVPEPVCWTEAPETLSDLGVQRNRWQRGLIDTLWRHCAMLGRPRYGVVGLAAMPCVALFELLGPVVEILGYLIVPLSYACGLLSTSFLLTFIAVALVYNMLLSITGVLLDDLVFRRYQDLSALLALVLLAAIENLGYRQLMAWWRLRGLWDYWRGSSGWGEMRRYGARLAVG
jgi:cellulose synthase/poly-beta-1,6-N-acetylglucosamine synthase-like glycosyltransferase